MTTTLKSNDEPLHDLHEGIKAICRLSPCEAFNYQTFDLEYESKLKSKKQFYILAWTSLIAFLISIFLLSYFLDQAVLNTEPQDQQHETIIHLRKMLSGFLTISFVGLAVWSARGALQLRKQDVAEEEARLRKHAHFPGYARLIYKALHKILDNKFPVYIRQDEKTLNLPIYDWFGRPRRNAMTALLGSEKHRQTLWKDGKVEKGSIALKERDLNEILKDLKLTIEAHRSTSKNERDSRALITAFQELVHLKVCIEVMQSKTYWTGKRKKTPINRIERLSIVIRDNWQDWEELRERVNFTRRNYPDYHAKELVSKLILAYSGNSSDQDIDFRHLQQILTGKDRTANWYFRDLLAVSHQDLVPKGTKSHHNS